MTKILFNNARGAASSLQMSPPFSFSDVTMSVFPLRASLPTLENFCGNYLNQAPNLVQFRPFVPFVYLVILDYGRMSLEAANMGWVSQREVAFGIPLRWLNAGKDGPEFHDWAFSSPFIFVDNELSMSTGREVYGWPKLLAKLDPSVSEWVRNPHGARRVFQVSTKGTTQAYAGQTSEYRPLLSVFQHRTAGLLDVPPNLDAIVKPLSQASNAAMGLSRLGADLAKAFVGMASDRITDTSVLPDMMDMNTLRAQLTPEKLRQWTSPKDWTPGIKDALWSLFPRMYANTVNFKQFRDAANPHGTCYQALTSARMPVKAFKEGGFLGPQNMMVGQLDGGFRIDIHHLSGLPIVESLGLEVSEEREVGDSRVSTLTPVAPIWMKVDMTYGLADTLIWRGRKDKWTEGTALIQARKLDEERRTNKTIVQELIDDVRSQPEPEMSAEVAEDIAAPDDPKEDIEPDLQPIELDDGQGFDYIRAMNFFNTTRGASEAVGGSFSIPNASVRVLPLKADSETLQKFVRDYLRVEKAMRFEAWGDFVYLVISDFKQMNSELSAISKRRARELTMMVPVKCYEWFKNDEFTATSDSKSHAEDARLRCKRGEEKLLTTGFVNAFTYVDDVETAITANEVFGVPSMGSTISASENEWLSRDQSKERSQHEILNMSAQVLPELMAGAQAVDRTLVDVSTHHPHHQLVQESEDEAVNKWVQLLADDLGDKIDEADSKEGSVNIGQGLALKLLGGDLSLNQFSLKQFRDSFEANSACYQGLILRRHTIDKLTDFREIDAPIHVSITDYPTQPISEMLGLKPKYTYPGPDRLIRVYEAVRPFSLNGDLRRGAGVTLFERVNSPQWKRIDLTEEYFGWRNLPNNKIASFLRDHDKGSHCELAYEFDNPLTKQPVEKRLRRVGIRFLKPWYDRRVRTNQVRNVMVRNRKEKAMVCVLDDPKVLSALDKKPDTDLAAWNNQMESHETQYSQAELAARVEEFSPATVLDKVLSRRWGISTSKGLPPFQKNDFCLPVESVPDRYADVLFPESECLNGYWPESYEHFKYQIQRRRTEFAAFKAELHTAIRAFAMHYPSVLFSDRIAEADSWSFDRLLNTMSEALYSYVDDEKAEDAKKHTRRALKDIQDEEDFEGMMRATDAVVTQFFNDHLPDIFKLLPETYSPLMYGYAKQDPSAGQATLREWKSARVGFLKLMDLIKQSLSDNGEAEAVIEEFFGPFIKRIDANIWELGTRRAFGTLGTSSKPKEISAPDLVLRKRLRTMVVGDDL